MLLSISASALKPILSALSKVIDQKDIMPIRSNLYLHQDQSGRVIATASSESYALHYVLPIDNCEDFSPICIPFQQLSEITGAIGDSIFPMEIRTGAHTQSKSPLEVVVDYGEGEFRFMAEDCNGYPVQQVKPATFTCQVPARAVFSSASAASGFTAKENLRPIMQGVCFDFRATGELRIVASDTRALYVRTVKDLAPSADCSIVLPVRGISVAVACIGKNDTVNVGTDGKFAIISDDRFSLEVVMLEGRFPRYEAILPKTKEMTVNIPVRNFVTSVNRAKVCANSATNQVRFSFVPSQTYAKVSADDFDLSKASSTSLVLTKPEQVSAEVAIGFRADLLLDAVSCLPTSDLNMCLNGPAKAATFEATDGSTVVLVMPQQII